MGREKVTSTLVVSGTKIEYKADKDKGIYVFLPKDEKGKGRPKADIVLPIVKGQAASKTVHNWYTAKLKGEGDIAGARQPLKPGERIEKPQSRGEKSQEFRDNLERDLCEKWEAAREDWREKNGRYPLTSDHASEVNQAYIDWYTFGHDPKGELRVGIGGIKWGLEIAMEYHTKTLRSCFGSCPYESIEQAGKNICYTLFGSVLRSLEVARVCGLPFDLADSLKEWGERYAYYYHAYFSGAESIEEIKSRFDQYTTFDPVFLSFSEWTAAKPSLKTKSWELLQI